MADNKPPVILIISMLVLIFKPLNNAVKLKLEDIAMLLILVFPALTEEQLLPALMTEQKA